MASKTSDLSIEERCAIAAPLINEKIENFFKNMQLKHQEQFQ